MNRQPRIAGPAYRGRTASIGFVSGPFVRVGAALNGTRGNGNPDGGGRRAARRASRRGPADRRACRQPPAARRRRSSSFRWLSWRTRSFSIRCSPRSPPERRRDAAWSAALDAQIADYVSAPDEYLQARSADLADLRDRVIRRLHGAAGDAIKIPAGAVVCADDLPPSQFLEIDWSKGGGLALMRGSPTSHVAMLARARGVPMVVQLGAISDGARTALLDGEGATLELDPSTEQIGLFEMRREIHRKSRASARATLRRPAASWDGERVRLLINIQSVEDLDHADAPYADGIGLMRTEFLLGGAAGLPDEETQYLAYDAVLRWAGERPVTIRTFDAGGDKPVAGFTRSRRSQSVPRRARSAPLPGAAGRFHRSAARARARRRRAAISR